MNTEIARNPQEIATRINEEHTRAFGKAQDALSHARAAGELLIEAKDCWRRPKIDQFLRVVPDEN
jgi:hypothetical protein